MGWLCRVCFHDLFTIYPENVDIHHPCHYSLICGTHGGGRWSTKEMHKTICSDCDRTSSLGACSNCSFVSFSTTTTIQALPTVPRRRRSLYIQTVEGRKLSMNLSLCGNTWVVQYTSLFCQCCDKVIPQVIQMFL